MIKYHAYLIFWRDSQINRGWRFFTDEDNHVAEIYSIGFVIKQNKKEITFTHSVSYDGSAPDAMTTPREAITKMIKLPQFIIKEDGKFRYGPKR